MLKWPYTPINNRLTPLKNVSNETWAFWVIVGLHFTVALYYKEVAGLDIAWMQWDELWQTIPVDLIQTDFWNSLWHFHAQPPLFNVYGAIFIKLFFPAHLQYMYLANIILGSLMSGMLFKILIQFSGSIKFSFVAAFISALSPALILYEAYPLYTLLTAFLVTSTVFCLALFCKSRNSRYLYLFVLMINLLILTRTLYHAIILLFAIPLTLFLAKEKWLHMLIVAILISLLSVGWYSKNWLQFGFIGESSWTGIGLWKIASPRYSSEELQSLVEAGKVDEAVANLSVFSKPSLFYPYGFTAVSNIPVMNRDNYNNINILAISEMYRNSALNLIRLNPDRYVINTIMAYVVFTSPSSRFYHLEDNAILMGNHEVFVSQIILGQQFIQQLIPFRDKTMGSILVILLPVNLLIYLMEVLKRNRFSIHKWGEYIRLEAPLVFTVFLILYTMAVSVALEYIENARFQFLVGQLIWAFMATTFYHAFARSKSQILAWFMLTRS